MTKHYFMDLYEKCDKDNTEMCTTSDIIAALNKMTLEMP